MKKINLIISGIGLSAAIAIFSCGGMSSKAQKDAKIAEDAFFASATTINCGAFCNPPTVSYQLPDEPCTQLQPPMNCFAWSNFLALNWLASDTSGVPDTAETAATYGEPGDFSPTVWESYLSIDDVFPDPSIKLLAAAKGVKKVNQIKQVRQLSKIDHLLGANNGTSLLQGASKANPSKMDEIFQAKGTWLTDQSGNVVWYEVRLNGIESDFIQQNQLNNLTKLTTYANTNQGVWLPNNAMELKAAWKVIPANDLAAAQPYYKISKAMVPEVIGFDSMKQPILGKYTEQYLGLVGLHIIRKTASSPQFIWMTFEHIHNAPTEGQVDNSIAYSFFNKTSQSTPNQSPDVGKDNIHTPVQVERIKANTISSDIQTLNKQMQEMIRQSNANSVWQYYQLVNVQWPASAIADKDNNHQIPLQAGGINPANIANTTLETYAQDKQCMDCHKKAGVNDTLATDYSFVFSRARAITTKRKRK